MNITKVENACALLREALLQDVKIEAQYDRFMYLMETGTKALGKEVSVKEWEGVMDKYVHNWNGN